MTHEDETNHLLRAILHHLHTLTDKVDTMSNELDALTAADKALDASVVAMLAYIQSLPKQIADAVAAAEAGDQAALGTLASDVQAQADKLSAALPVVAPVA